MDEKDKMKMNKKMKLNNYVSYRIVSKIFQNINWLRFSLNWLMLCYLIIKD